MQVVCFTPAITLVRRRPRSDGRTPQLGWKAPICAVNAGAAATGGGERRAMPKQDKIKVLRHLAARGLWRDLVQRVDTLKCNERLVSFAASQAYDAGEAVVASQLFKRMRLRGVRPGAYSYSVMLKGLARMRVGHEAVDAILRDIESDEVPLDSVLLNSVADAYVRTGALRMAVEFVLCDEHRPLRNARSFNILMRGYVRSDELDEAFLVFDGMKADGVKPTEVTLNTLINGCARAGRYEEVKKLSEELEELLCTDETDGENKKKKAKNKSTSLGVAHTSVLMSHADAGRLDLALSLLAEMESRDVPPSGITYAALIKGCLRNGQVEAAMSVIKALPPTATNRLVAYNALVRGLCSQHGFEGTERAHAVVYAMQSSDVRPSAETYNELINGLVRLGLWERAEEVRQNMADRSVPPDVVTYTTLIRGYGAACKVHQVKLSFSRMIRSGLRPDAVALNTLIAAFCRCNDVDSALKVLQQIEGEPGTWKPSAATYSPLLAVYTRLNDFERAWDMYERMRNKGVRPNAFVCDMLFNTLRIFAEETLEGGRIGAARSFAERCAILLQDSCACGVKFTIARRWRRVLLHRFGTRQKILLQVLDEANLPPELASVSEQIFKKHGWNDIDSGWKAM